DKFFDTDDEHPGEGDREVFKHLRPDSVRDELERSLARLRTDRIDLYQTHWQESTTAIEDTMACLLELKAAGKVRAIGCSNVTDDELRAYDAAGRADVDQDKYSMLDRGPDETRLGLCRELGVSFLAYSPLALGLLTGKVKPDATFPSGDLRSRRERFSAENLTRVQSMLDELRPIAERLGLTLAQLAIAWTVSRPGLTHALVGARTPDQARANARAGERLLDEGEAAEITAIVDRHRDGIV
ncbi:MAG: aldo/keto reductase, partial [Planctomycetota bacterium]